MNCIIQIIAKQALHKFMAERARAFDRGAWLIICWINYFITLNGWERSLELSCMVISIKARSISLR
jgi:hypothetical protein